MNTPTLADLLAYAQQLVNDGKYPEYAIATLASLRRLAKYEAVKVLEPDTTTCGMCGTGEFVERYSYDTLADLLRLETVAKEKAEAELKAVQLLRDAVTRTLNKTEAELDALKKDAERLARATDTLVCESNGIDDNVWRLADGTEAIPDFTVDSFCSARKDVCDALLPFKTAIDAAIEAVKAPEPLGYFEPITKSFMSLSDFALNPFANPGDWHLIYGPEVLDLLRRETVRADEAEKREKSKHQQFQAYKDRAERTKEKAESELDRIRKVKVPEAPLINRRVGQGVIDYIDTLLDALRPETVAKDEAEFSWRGCATQLADAIADLEKAEAENAALRKDAERYRWLQNNVIYRTAWPAQPTGTPPFLVSFRLDEWAVTIDAAIDAAMERGE